MIPLIFGLGTSEMILILVIVLLLFGGSKIPELMKGIGKGIKELKKGMNDVDDVKEEIKKEIEKPIPTEKK